MAMELDESTPWAVAQKVHNGHRSDAQDYADWQINQLEAAGDFRSATAWRSIADRIVLLIDQSRR